MARGGGPPNQCRITGTPSLSEVPSGGARAFCLLLRFSKVSRRQGGTLRGRYRSNGYVHNPTVSPVRPPSRASQLPHWIAGCQVDRRRLGGRHRRQASSHIGLWGARWIGVGWEAAIAGKPAPTFGLWGARWIGVGWKAAIAGKPAPTFGLWGVKWIGVGWKAGIAGKPAPTGSIFMPTDSALYCKILRMPTRLNNAILAPQQAPEPSGRGAS